MGDGVSEGPGRNAIISADELLPEVSRFTASLVSISASNLSHLSAMSSTALPPHQSIIPIHVSGRVPQAGIALTLSHQLITNDPELFLQVAEEIVDRLGELRGGVCRGASIDALGM